MTPQDILHALAQAGSAQAVAELVKPTWTAPELWKGVRVGHCAKCGQPHVLRNALCWTCEQAQ